MRNPNTNCDNCNKLIYKRPFELEKYNHKFCSKNCIKQFYYNQKEKENCIICKKEFVKKKNTQKFCSKKCSGIYTRNRKPSSKKRLYKNESERRFLILKNTFNFDSCMIKDCTYNKTYDIHRLIEGNNNGKYEIGNMFAICPNHHAEIHRNIIKVKKINDYTLEIER